MVDFLKAFPFMTMEDYRWNLSIPMIRIMMIDHTRVEYLSKKEVERSKATVISSADELLNDLGCPIMENKDAK
jgi:hypothetical protein